MHLFRSVLQKQRDGLLIALFCVCSYSVSLLLYDVNPEVILYPVLLCIAVCVIWFVVGCMRTYRKLSALDRLKRRIPLELPEEPEPENAEEALYRECLGLLFDAKSTLAADFERKSRDMTDYYTLWAHQIKTPIAAMHLLLQEGESENSREISDELLRIEQYVEMVLGYLRLEGGVNDLVIRRCSLDEILRGAIRKYKRQFILKRIALDFTETELTVLTDQKWLSFVIEQLLSNALKYTDSGKISIRAESDDRLVIEDTGIGIAPEDIKRVCEKGYTGLNGRYDQKSTGIGLYLCSRIVKLLGHSMSLESQPGRGTRVLLDLTSLPLKVE